MQLNAGAQVMTLRDCMEYAVSNSTQVRIQQSKNDDARLDRRDAILAAFTPSADGNSYGYYRWGRSIDPETNTYVTTTSLNQGFSVSAGITLFNGFSQMGVDPFVQDVLKGVVLVLAVTLDVASNKKKS